MILRPTTRRPAPAFTLIELVTVMAILGILIAMSVGAYRTAMEGAKRDSTLATLGQLKAALQDYADDWGHLYPWTATTGSMGQVNDDLKLASGEYAEEALLFAALTMRRRHGPYVKGVQDFVETRKQDSDTFAVFVDGWGNVIEYEAGTPPVLTSPGRNGDLGDDDDLSTEASE